jgi:hypothetical protein
MSMTGTDRTLLLDANVLIAMINERHVHYERANAWFAALKPRFATCPITEGALVRQFFRESPAPTETQAHELLRHVRAMQRHEFWPDALPYPEVSLVRVIGHKMVTDAYLVALAAFNHGTLATLDERLAALYDGVLLIDSRDLRSTEA